MLVFSQLLKHNRFRYPPEAIVFSRRADVYFFSLQKKTEKMNPT
jgi:hypothetical protein